MRRTTSIKDAEDALQPGNISDALDSEYIEFADLAVHDLDAPLRKLSVLVDMLTDKVRADNELQPLIERIKNCVGDMRSLIDDLNIWGRIDHHEPAAASCDLEAIVRAAIQEMPAEPNERKAIITTSTLPTIKGDPDLLLRLFGILLANAIQYSKKSMTPEVNIQSSLLSAKEKGDWGLVDNLVYHKIVFSDKGIGFSNENATKIFRPFVRLHGKAQYPGNGIGLAMCKKILDVHDGIIHAEGAENEGASFILILPESH